MKNCQATWEDAENNRQVELVVNYRLDATRALGTMSFHVYE